MKVCCYFFPHTVSQLTQQQLLNNHIFYLVTTCKFPHILGFACGQSILLDLYGYLFLHHPAFRFLGFITSINIPLQASFLFNVQFYNLLGLPSYLFLHNKIFCAPRKCFTQNIKEKLKSVCQFPSTSQNKILI